MRKMFAYVSDRMVAMYIAVVSLLSMASVSSAADSEIPDAKKWTGIDSGDTFNEGVKLGLRATQGIAIAFLIFSGLKIVANWGSGSEEGGRDKGALVKWALAFFLTLIFLALSVWIQTTLFTSGLPGGN